MFRPQIQKTGVLLSLATYCILMVWLVFYGRTEEKTDGYEDKVKATEIMENALSVLNKEVDNPNVSIDNDPNKTGLIFDDRDSPMITYISESRTLGSKQTVLKPNFAAFMVDRFIKVGLSRGDTIAVGMTGSFPGANIALYSACEAMELVPIVITSIGASEWGAIDSNYTWLDLENILFENNVIFHKSEAASLGGYSDMFSQGGPIGKKLAAEAIERNEIDRIVYNRIDRVKDRDSVFRDNIHDLDLENYSAYVNIGGGVGSIGIKGRSKYGYGILDKEKVLSTMGDKLQNGIIQVFAKHDVQLINIQQIDKLIIEDGKSLMTYGIGDEDPEPGEGPLFYYYKFNLLITVLALLSTIGIVVVVGINSFREINKHMNSYETESIL